MLTTFYVIGILITIINSCDTVPQTDLPIWKWSDVPRELCFSFSVPLTVEWDKKDPSYAYD